MLMVLALVFLVFLAAGARLGRVAGLYLGGWIAAVPAAGLLFCAAVLYALSHGRTDHDGIGHFMVSVLVTLPARLGLAFGGWRGALRRRRRQRPERTGSPRT